MRCARDNLKHNCAAKLNCPLKLQLEQLVREIDFCCDGCEILTRESVIGEEGGLILGKELDSERESQERPVIRDTKSPI